MLWSEQITLISTPTWKYVENYPKFDYMLKVPPAMEAYFYSESNSKTNSHQTPWKTICDF